MNPMVPSEQFGYLIKCKGCRDDDAGEADIVMDNGQDKEGALEEVLR